MYISVIKDLYDNSILAYKISKFNDMNIVMNNIKEIINDKIWNPQLNASSIAIKVSSIQISYISNILIVMELQYHIQEKRIVMIMPVVKISFLILNLNA